MVLAPGTKLGPYEVVAPLGAGGMGEVYRARDARLERDVAVKILPQHLSSDPDLKARFEREARSISALSHPHICHLYDIGSQDGTDYLVMELLEGQTLAQRLERGPLPVKQVLERGIEIAEALEKAHKNGIVHRDLKPGNIMVTKSGAKLLDFGLAKPTGGMAAMTSASVNTMSKPLTAEGKIVGTYQYMAPEQVEGKDADARTDIFAFGAVLYEMVSGKRAFGGKSQISVLSAILESDPNPLSASQPLIPAALDHVIQRALAKDPEERWQSAADMKAELKWIAQGGSQAGVASKVRAGGTPWARWGWPLAALLLLLGICGGAVWWFGSRQTPRAMYFNSSLSFPTNDIALSPDGRLLALVAYSDQANKYVIWTHEVGGRSAAAVPGTEDASHPFWAPDGRSIGFFAQGKLKTVDAFSGRSPQVLADAPNGRGGAWNQDNVILFSPEVFTGLYRVSSAGGTPIQVTTPDTSKFETSHRWPFFLPDGKHFLYLAANFSGRFDKNVILLGSLDSSEKRTIVSSDANAAYAEPGYLLYRRDNALVAQHFDARTYALSGEPRTISDGVQYFPQTDLALFGVAGNKTLVVQTGKGAAKSQLVWFDRSGKQLGTVGQPGFLADPSLSPDGRRVAFQQVDSDGRHVDIWIRDLTNDAIARLTFGPGLNELPVWSPDAKRIAYAANHNLNYGLYQKNADGSGSGQEMATSSGAYRQGFSDWSRDGQYLLVWKSGELWYFSGSDLQLKPLFQGKWVVRNAQFSPDGKWIAYSSNETGNWEIYVSPFPAVNSKWQVSRGSGEEPRWRRDGKELFYLSADRKMMAVSVKTSSNFESGTPLALFQPHLRQSISANDLVSYDVSADGRRFLINAKVDEPNAAPLAVVLNWSSEMEK
jgi:eukaryotic-like serine/threonine-protein kinase